MSNDTDETDLSQAIGEAAQELESVEDELAHMGGMDDIRERVTDARSQLVSAALNHEISNYPPRVDPRTLREVSDDGEQKTVRMRKGGVESAALATAVWSDLLSFTYSRMEDMETDEYDIEIEVVIRE